LAFTPPAISRPITPAVNTDEIASLAITGAKIADSAVTAAKLALNAVTTTKIADKAVTGAKIKDYDIGYTQIASNSINREKIINGEIISEKISNGAVTQEKLAPGVGGDRFVWGAEGQTGNPRASADVLYLTDISADIPYTVFDLSAWVPANAKGVILQLGMFNQAFTSGRAFFRVRTNADQRDALGLGNMVGLNSQVANQGIVPLVVGTGPRTIEYTLESVGGPWVATFTLWVTVVGYIM